MSSTERTRQELITALTQLSRLRPDWRLGQMIGNLATTAGRLEAGGVWDIEDEEALSAAKRLIEQYSEAETVAVPQHATPGGDGD